MIFWYQCLKFIDFIVSKWQTLIFSELSYLKTVICMGKLQVHFYKKSGKTIWKIRLQTSEKPNNVIFVSFVATQYYKEQH